MAQLFDPQALSSILPIWGSLHSFGTEDPNDPDSDAAVGKGLLEKYANGANDAVSAPDDNDVAGPSGALPQPIAGSGSRSGALPQPLNTRAISPALSANPSRDFQLSAPNFDQLPSSPRAGQLKGALDARQFAQPDTKSLLIKAITTIAPILAARAIGGTFAGAGAAQGTSDALINQQNLETERRKELITQVQGEEGRQEREYEAGMRGQLAQAQIQGLNANRDLMATLKNNANNNQQQHYRQMYDQSLRKSGQRINTETGDVENIPRAELPAHDQAMLDLSDAKEDLVRAQAAGIPARIAVAKQSVTLAMQRLNIALEGLQLRKENAAATNYGTDLAGNPLPGAPLDDTGAPTGSRFAAGVRPTGQMRDKAAQGTAISKSGQGLIDSLRNPDGTPTALAGKIGPILGRISSLDQLLEVQDSDVQKYASELASYAALQPGLHGFRGGNALKHFTGTIGSLPRSADNMIASIEGIEKGAVGPMEEVGTPKLAKGAGTSTQLTKNKAKVTHKFNPKSGKIEAIQ